jgi:hypothetical protein
MKPSQSKAASAGKINAGLQKLLGTPSNISTGPCNSRSTEAAGRPAVNSSISGMKFGDTPNDFGKNAITK